MKQRACRLNFTTALGFHGKTFSGWQANSFFEWSRNMRIYNEFIESITNELHTHKDKPRIAIYGGGIFGQTLLNIIEGHSLAEVVAIVDKNATLAKNFPQYDFFNDIEELKITPPIDSVVIATSPAHYSEIVNKLTSSTNSSFTDATSILFMFDDYTSPDSHPKSSPKTSNKIVISTLMKSGTWWLAGLLEPLLTENCRFKLNFDATIPSFHQIYALNDDEYTFGHFASDEISYFFNFPDYKFIFLYRDLRDQVTSLHLFHKYRKHPKEQYSITLQKRHKLLKYLTDNDSLTLHIKGTKPGDAVHIPSVKESSETIKKWIEHKSQNSNIHLVKYEELQHNTYETMCEILSFLNIDIDSKSLEKSIENSSFKKMSKGRDAGTEDTTSHQRKGIIGDWKNHFTDQHKKIFKSEVGEFLIEAGYEKNNDW